jgi:hypothetical protein
LKSCCEFCITCKPFQEVAKDKRAFRFNFAAEVCS